jgi:cytochrome c oxidase cbb3-type subunit 3
MNREARDVTSDCEYDGIREYENPCPGWWSFLFFGTFVFSLGYFFFFQFSPASWTVLDSYDSSVADNLRLQFAEIGELRPDEATLIKYAHDDNWSKVGRIVFATHCQSCHAADAAGLVGPNLTDDYYKNIARITDIANVVAEGAAGGAMPAWRTRLHPNELVLVSAYVASLRGKNLPGPRGQEGSVIPPWPEDSGKTDSAPAGTAPGKSKQERS